MLIPEKDFEKIRELHERSLHLQAFQTAQSVCPLPNWEGTKAVLLAANLAYNLGALETSWKWTKKAWRKDKKHPRAMFYYGNELFHRKGALPALIFLRKYKNDFAAEGKLLGWWNSLYAEIFSQLRDFRTSDAWHQKAIQAAPEDVWVWVSQAHTLELQDRYEEALEISRIAFDLQPWQRSSVFALAHNLSLLERYDEALEILTEAASRLENAWVVKQLADLQTELGMHKEAYASLERLLELTPMREDSLEQWLYGNLSDAAYLGDIKQAIRFADISSSPFHLKIKERLENLRGTEKRVRLKLGFVRQHHMTCAPATVSNISRFWQKSAPHLEIAEEICYDGTPAYKERGWANENGWETREFTVNWQDTIELINRGVPFTLATVQPGSGHLQAIIGYDESRRTFLVRDPYFQRLDEFAAEELLEEQKSSGPRGMALVPKEKSHLLQDLELKDAREYDFHFAVDSNLEKHNRARANEILSEMGEAFPDHRLTWSARWSLAHYDANHPRMMEAVENLQKQFPEDINLKLSFLSLSGNQTTRDERLATLESFCRAEKTDPLLWQMFGYELGRDARSHGRALSWLYKSLRRLPVSGTYRAIADILWSKRRFEEATELYRYAACLSDKDEQNAYSYFLAARHLKQTEKALRFLQDRFDRFGHQSRLPVQSLFHALRELGRTVEAFEALEKALEKRPADGELKLFAAEAKARFGRQDEAEELLGQAENQSPRNVWLRYAAMIAELRGNLKQSLANWREIVELEPLAYDAHESISFLLAATEGKKAGQDYLREATNHFPFNRDLHKLRLSLLREESDEAVEILKHLLKINPQDAWGEREMARWLCFERKYAEALDAAERAIALEPNEPYAQWVRGTALSELGKYEEAARAFEKAITLSVDADYALSSRIKICRTKEEKLAALRFMRRELETQVSFGSGVFAYRDQAKRILEPEELLAELKKIYSNNEDYWFALSALVQQLIDMHRLDEALELAEKATEKFPLIQQIWHDLSVIYKIRGEYEQEIKFLQQALKINGNWSFGIQQLVEAFERAGRFAEAKEALEDALRRLPLDHFLYGYLAEVCWKLDEREEAIDAARKAIALEPEYEWAWQAIKLWADKLKQPTLAADLAREVTVKKPKDIGAWLTYAQILDTGRFSQEQLDAAERALELEPKNVLALAIKANALADARRFDEAIEICQTKFADGYQHERLRYVQAGIESMRGNFEEAVRQLNSLTASVPDYYPAWERLADIYRSWEERRADYLRVTRELTRLAPQDASAFGFLGEAYLFNNKRDDAKKAFEQSIKLAPEYPFAGCSLFDLYFEEKDTENSRRILQILSEFVKNESSLVREIAFYAKSGDLEKSRALWEKLCLSENAVERHFQYVLEKFQEFKLGDANFILETLRRTSLEKRANALVGSFLIQIAWGKEGEKSCRRELEKLLGNEKVWSEAVVKFMELMLAGKRYSKLRAFIEENYTELGRYDEVWGSTGYVLHTVNDFKQSQKWFSGWEKRERVLPWALWNYSLALRNNGHAREAAEINRAALNLERDNTINQHLMMLGLEEIYAENYQKAESIFGEIDARTFNKWDGYFYFLLDVGLEIYRHAANNQPKEASDSIRELVNLSLSQTALRTDKIMRESFKRSVAAAFMLSQNTWLKIWLRIKIFYAGLGFR
ncbi:MAG TPA: tetratricopeptide repeat protein [Pyrinomonadaceae bacterium]|jgi:tetratricopeptide (TPR) repeat protein